MSTILNPEINKLPSDSLCYSVYLQLYNNFYNAQDSNTLVEGSEISIRLHNMAYNFADAISKAANGGSEPDEGILTSYVKKSGDDMSGIFRANYGFQAGINNQNILQTFEDQEKGIGMEVTGSLFIGGSSLYIGNKQVIQYNEITSTTHIESELVDFRDSKLHVNNEILVGIDKEHGILISPTLLQVKGKSVYHEGNSNRPDISWHMENAEVFGHLHVIGSSDFSDILEAYNGVFLGSDGKKILAITNNTVSIEGNLKFLTGYGIKIDNNIVLGRLNKTDIQLGAIGGDVYLGSEGTNKIRLQNGLADINGNIIISEYGNGYFPGSLIVKHNLGEELLTSYRVDNKDEGIIIHKKLRFKQSSGPWIDANENEIVFHSSIKTPLPIFYSTRITHALSTSLHLSSEENSSTSLFNTDCALFTFSHPVESTDYIGIDGSFTKLMNKSLFFTKELFIIAGDDGIKHNGNNYFLGNVSSEIFASGFSGSGWSIYQDVPTGNYIATVDELVIRKRMRVYEMEIQKIEVTQGDLWVSSSTKGDTVVKL